jgi:hypothetical protein
MNAEYRIPKGVSSSLLLDRGPQERLAIRVSDLIRHSDFIIRHFERSVPRSDSDNRTSTSTASASRGVQSSSGTRSVS